MKKFLKIALACLCLLPVALIFCACGEDNKKCYYTIADIPQHISGFELVNQQGGVSMDSKGSFFEKNSTLVLRFSVDIGYKIDDFKVKVNGDAIQIDYDQSAGNYSGTFVCTKDFDVTFEGSPKIKESSFSLGYNLYTTEEENQNIFVAVKNFQQFGIEKSELTLKEYKEFVDNLNNSNTNNFLLSLEKPFDIKVYTKQYSFGIKQIGLFATYDSEQNRIWSGFESEDSTAIFDEQNNIFGFESQIKPVEDTKLELTVETFAKIKMLFASENLQSQISFENDLLSATVAGISKIDSGSNIKTPYVDFSDFASLQNAKIRINFERYADQEYKTVYDNMQLSIYGRPLTLQRATDGSYIEFSLERPYKYVGNTYYDQYIFTTNLLEELVQANLAVLKTNSNYSLAEIFVENQNVTSNTEYDQFNRLQMDSSNAYIAKNSNNDNYFMSDAKVCYNVEFFEDNDFKFAKINNATYQIGTSSENLPFIERQENLVDGQKTTIYKIYAPANLDIEKIEFFSTNPNVIG